MFKYAIILAGIQLMFACDNNTVLYEGFCLSLSCYNDKVPRMARFSSGYGINYNVSTTSDGRIPNYLVSISYPDDPTNPLTSDPDCVQWRVYQTKNAQDVDATRKYVQFYPNGSSLVPQWPVAKFSTLNKASTISFIINQSDLLSRGCIPSDQKQGRRWLCFFEFAFVLRNMTQVSHFFDIIVQMNNFLGGAIGNRTQPTQVDVYRAQTIFNMYCPQTGKNKDCQITLKVNSSLHFCSNQSCVQTADKPFGSLQVNKIFYMKHQIDDNYFSKGWAIGNVNVQFNSKTLILTLDSNSLKILRSTSGFNIYQMQVPIVSDNVLIVATGTLQQRQRMLEDATDSSTTAHQVKVTEAQIYSGAVGTASQVIQNKLMDSSGFWLTIPMVLLIAIQ